MIFFVLSANFLIKCKQLQDMEPTCACGSAFRLLQLPSIDLSEKFLTPISRQLVLFHFGLMENFISQLYSAGVVTFSSEIQQTSSPESEEGIIPDSPVLPSSMPASNRLKKRRNGNKDMHIHYAEMPLSQANKSRFRGQPALL